MKRMVLGFLVAVLLAGPVGAANMENTLYMELKTGRVVIELRPDLAPKHVARIKELARQKFYDGVVFHRVIEGFMAQGGDPKGTGRGGSGKKLEAEFSKEPHVRGTLSMARSAHPDSADSQFFIVFAPSSFLDGKYTVWGKVAEGMEHVDQIKKGDQSRNGSVEEPDKIVSLTVAADESKKKPAKKKPAKKKAPKKPTKK
jgi:peptidylprolyl isomerase